MGINGRGPKNSMFAGCFLSRSRVRDVSEIQRLVRRAVRGWLLSSNLSVLKTHCRSGLRDKRSMLEALSVCKQVLRRWHEEYIDIERNVLIYGTMAPIARHRRRLGRWKTSRSGTEGRESPEWIWDETTIEDWNVARAVRWKHVFFQRFLLSAMLSLRISMRLVKDVQSDKVLSWLHVN